MGCLGFIGMHNGVFDIGMGDLVAFFGIHAMAVTLPSYISGKKTIIPY